MKTFGIVLAVPESGIATERAALPCPRPRPRVHVALFLFGCLLARGLHGAISLWRGTLGPPRAIRSNRAPGRRGRDVYLSFRLFSSPPSLLTHSYGPLPFFVLGGHGNNSEVLLLYLSSLQQLHERPAIPSDSSITLCNAASTCARRDDSGNFSRIICFVNNYFGLLFVHDRR